MRVDTERVALDREARRLTSGVTGAAPDVEHVVGRLHVGGREHRLGVRGEGCVLDLLCETHASPDGPSHAAACSVFTI